MVKDEYAPAPSLAAAGPATEWIRIPVLLRDSGTRAGMVEMPVQQLLGKCVHNDRGQLIGTIESIAGSAEKGVSCTVVGTCGHLGVGIVPLASLAMTDNKLCRISLAQRLRAQDW